MYGQASSRHWHGLPRRTTIEFIKAVMPTIAKQLLLLPVQKLPGGTSAKTERTCILHGEDICLVIGYHEFPR